MISVKLFAAARERMDDDAITVDVVPPVTVAELRVAMIAQYPSLEPIVAHSNYAVDQRYVNEQFLVHGGAEVALIPPVSGG